MMNFKEYNKQIYYILLIMLVILLGFIFKMMSQVVTPVLVAAILSFVFYPVVKKLNARIKIPWVLGTLIMAFAVVICFLILSTIIGTSLSAFLNQYPKYESKFLSIYKVIADAFNLQYYSDKTFIENLWSQFKVREFIQSFAISTSGNVVIFIKNIGVVILFMIFLLIEMRVGHAKINVMFEQKESSGRVLKITKKVIADTMRFLSIKFFISLATGVCVYLGCLLIGLDFAVLWAFLSFVMNFIPTFGSIFSVVLTTLFSLLQFYPSPFRIIFILLYMTSVNMILGNVLEPKIEGENLGISPFIILVSLTFWGWMLGFIGMIIAVPLMVVIKIVCENVSFLRPLAILIGNKPEETVKEMEGTADSTELKQGV